MQDFSASAWVCHTLSASAHFPRASPIRRHICSGVSGISRSATPRPASASRAALTTAAGAPIEPASPQPLAPSGLCVQVWVLLGQGAQTLALNLS
jgi:hypothetical protein